MTAPTFVYVGTYTSEKSKGIYLFRLQTDHATTLAPLGVAAETPNPSFLEIDARRLLLFAVNEIDQFDGEPGGAVTAFSIDRTTGKLTPLNQQPSMGSGPCHLVLDKQRRHLLVANYNSGSVSVVPVGADGRLGPPSDVVQHSGSSANPDRQKGPHAHCVTMESGNRFAFVCDLGLDKVMIYRFDAERGKLTPHDPPFAAIKPGSGPRHMVFRPDGRVAYVFNEMSSTVNAFSYAAGSGVLKEIQTIATLPAYFTGDSTAAEIDVHPSGRWLYVSNRGHDTVVLFSIDSSTGTLTLVEEQVTRGATPRHFGIDPSGRHFAVGNQNSDTILIAEIDGDNGRLKPSGALASAPTPVCIKFLPPKENDS